MFSIKYGLLMAPGGIGVGVGGGVEIAGERGVLVVFVELGLKADLLLQVLVDEAADQSETGTLLLFVRGVGFGFDPLSEDGMMLGRFCFGLAPRCDDGEGPAFAGGRGRGVEVELGQLGVGTESDLGGFGGGGCC
jgi:hypothetical protein